MSIINDIVKYMWEYQEKYNIKNQCLANAVYLCDQIHHTGVDILATVKAVIMVYITEDEMKVWGGHIVVQLNDGQFIDPSYETNSLRNTEYFDNIKDLLSAYPILKDDTELLKTLIGQIMIFSKYANDINLENKCIVSNLDYFHKQADYIDAKFSQMT
jgi:hypothetical protein